VIKQSQEKQYLNKKKTFRKVDKIKSLNTKTIITANWCRNENLRMTYCYASKLVKNNAVGVKAKTILLVIESHQELIDRQKDRVSGLRQELSSNHVRGSRKKKLKMLIDEIENEIDYFSCNVLVMKKLLDLKKGK
jgi:hypothetical protein